MTKPTDTPPPGDQHAADTPTVADTDRDARGRYAKKSGAQPGNQNAVTHGGRKATTPHGAIKHRDKFVRRGQDAATRFWNDTNCHPKDARRRTLAILESEIARCEDQMGADYKPHTRDLEVKPLTARFDTLVERRDSLWSELRKMYSPVIAKPVEERRHVFVVRFSDGRAVFHSPIAGGTDEHALCDLDRALAAECLEGADVAATDEHIQVWWLGRLWNGYGDRVATFDNGEVDAVGMAGYAPERDATPESASIPPPEQPVTASSRNGAGPDTPKTNGSPSDGSKPATIEPTPPTVRPASSTEPPPKPAPAAAPTNVVPFLGSAAHRNFDTGKGR